MKLSFRRSVIKGPVVVAMGRHYVVSSGVFDPKKHLSGVLFSSFLKSEQHRWSGARVLELGTGCGLLAGVLHDLGASVVATDVSKRATRCAQWNLRATSVDVRTGDLFTPVAGERFDAIVVNPPYKVGPSLRPTIRSRNMLKRLAAQWPDYADELVLAFPTDSADTLKRVGFDLGLYHRLNSTGRELGIYNSR